MPLSEELVGFKPHDAVQEFQTSAQEEIEYSQENPQNNIDNIQSSYLELD